ncbi:hypothetical protein Fmac_009625 [Flemingia macrophylla]|uniref:Uncharacterized protein n=1 Tax=Flemingia macrophylla TaxID=520843 RepID=A0ABD1N0R9_9FABA
MAAESLMQLMRLLGEDDHVDEPQPQPRRNHNTARVRAPHHNAQFHDLPPQSFSNGGSQNMKALINNTGFGNGNGNGSIVFGNFDASKRTFN